MPRASSRAAVSAVMAMAGLYHLPALLQRECYAKGPWPGSPGTLAKRRWKWGRRRG